MFYNVMQMYTLQVISGLERSIARYKEEYAILIADVQAIKSDLASVEKKVDKRLL